MPVVSNANLLESTSYSSDPFFFGMAMVNELQTNEPETFPVSARSSDVIPFFFVVSFSGLPELEA